MSSYDIRDPKTDHLLTAQNAALMIIDYQPVQVNSINSMSRKQLISNIVAVAELAKTFDIPIVLSTVNVKTGINKETIPSLTKVLEGVASYDRTTINAWEDKEFNDAVKNTGRRKLLIAALWTEACLTFPTLGTSVIAHETALRRVEQAGAKLTGIAQLACELQRDWGRHETVQGMVKALTDVGAFLKL